MSTSTTNQSVIVSRESFDSEDPYDVIYSNITFINALYEEHFTTDEQFPDALRSYYVDYYLAQINNGGFSQFVYNSEWNPKKIQFVSEGLQAMGAVEHLKLFNESAAILDRIGPEGMEKFFASGYFGENQERDILNEFDKKFYKLKDSEDLFELNSAWLKSLPNLIVMTEDEMTAEVQRRAATQSDRKDRIAKALAAEPRDWKLIRALCLEAGHDFSRVTSADSNYEYNGKPVFAVHFLSDQGHHYMVEVDGKAMMFNGESNQQIAEIESTEDFGTD